MFLRQMMIVSILTLNCVACSHIYSVNVNIGTMAVNAIVNWDTVNKHNLRNTGSPCNSSDLELITSAEERETLCLKGEYDTDD